MRPADYLRWSPGSKDPTIKGTDIAVSRVAALREKCGFSPETIARYLKLTAVQTKVALDYAQRNGMLPTMFEGRRE